MKVLTFSETHTNEKSAFQKLVSVGDRSPAPVGICMLKVNNRNTRTRCEICSKFAIKTPERCYWRRSGVVIVNFELILHLVLVILLLTVSK